MIDFIISNWAAILGAGIFICGVGYMGYRFFTLPLEDQIDHVKEWLLFAVIEAEKDFGAGVGEVKLRSVYEQFLVVFPYLAQLISFEEFSGYVDEALDSMKELLSENENIASYLRSKE